MLLDTGQFFKLFFKLFELARIYRGANRASAIIFKHGLQIRADREICFYYLSAMILMSFTVFINLISSDL
jgi:hypothetical protein